MKKSYENARRKNPESVNYKHDLGQNFLYDEELLQSLVDATGVGPADAVLEIGPGAGTLTKCLCRTAGKVLAVEVDHDVLPFLRLATENCGNLTIVEGDIRKLNLKELCEPLGQGFYVIANIPYNITSQIFDLLWESHLPIRQISVMVQKEVAQKLLAQPGDDAYGLMSFRCAYHCTGRLIQIVPAEKFTPPPKVDSAFVRLDLRDAPPIPVEKEEHLMRIVKAGFMLRRKTLMNSLKGTVEPDLLKKVMQDMNLSPTLRGETLSVEQWIEFSNRCCKSTEVTE